MIYFPDQLDRKQTDNVQGLLEPARESEGEHFVAEVKDLMNSTNQ